jgi:hypothetical protein
MFLENEGGSNKVKTVGNQTTVKKPVVVERSRLRSKPPSSSAIAITLRSSVLTRLLASVELVKHRAGVGKPWSELVSTRPGDK